MTPKKPKESWVIFVYCRHCNHFFADSLNWEKAKQPKMNCGFVCPFCHTILWVK